MRRFGLLAVAAALALVLAGCDWPMFGFDAAGTRSSPDTSISLSAVAAAGPNRAWTATGSAGVSSSPAVANGVLYVGDNNGKLLAFDAVGAKNCSGSPKSCTPLWTATRGSTSVVNFSSPAVANRVVYIGSDEKKLYAFDAAGKTNCAGTPKTCKPLWTGTTGGSVFSSPVVANGVVYVGAGDQKVYAFDAAGGINCSGAPKTCAPLWTATTGDVRATAVANGILYVGAEGSTGYLAAFNAAGTTNCSGTPKTCAPLWTTSGAGGSIIGIAVTDAMVYVTAHAGAVGALLAYDAHGGTSCFAEQCYPLWEAGFAGGSAPAVANGVVYVGGPALYAFDAAGVKGCTGRVIGPRPAAGTCVPLWSAATAPYYQGSAPAVANGVVYIGAGGSCCVGFLVAFDAAGTMHCSGTPKTCTPVWTSDTGFDPIESSPAVANGFVYVGDSFNTGVAAFHFG